MTEEQAEAYLAALESEKKGYKARKLPDRVKEVDAEIKRVKRELGEAAKADEKADESEQDE